MAKKQTRLDELHEQEIDYSMPIDRFARKALALLRKMAREMKERPYTDGAEYNDGGARIYASGLSIKFIVKFDKAVRKLAREHREMKKLKLKVTSVEVRGYEIFVSFN